MHGVVLILHGENGKQEKGVMSADPAQPGTLTGRKVNKYDSMFGYNYAACFTTIRKKVLDTNSELTSYTGGGICKRRKKIFWLTWTWRSGSMAKRRMELGI